MKDALKSTQFLRSSDLSAPRRFFGTHKLVEHTRCDQDLVFIFLGTHLGNTLQNLPLPWWILGFVVARKQCLATSPGVQIEYCLECGRHALKLSSTHVPKEQLEVK